MDAESSAAVGAVKPRSAQGRRLDGDTEAQFVMTVDREQHRFIGNIGRRGRYRGMSFVRLSTPKCTLIPKYYWFVLAWRSSRKGSISLKKSAGRQTTKN
jgi:hypothetical protein